MSAATESWPSTIRKLIYQDKKETRNALCATPGSIPNCWVTGC